MILAGDVGGTNTRLALFARSRGRLVTVAQQRVKSRAASGLPAILTTFLRGRRARLEAACFGVAGPVINGRCRGANLPWTVDQRAVQAALRINAVAILNDLESTAYGIAALPPRSFATLQQGRPQRHGPIAVLAAGTGLGEAALVWTGARYQAVATEGGHADFAPSAPRDLELLRALRQRYGHVSWERVLSGPGKLALYTFLRRRAGTREPSWLTAAMRAGDASTVVSEMAVAGRSALCRQALDWFAELYGAEAGNCALRFLARGGVYLGGGIAPTILPFLKGRGFLRAFRDKGRLAPLMKEIPVRVILDDGAALVGAAHYAMQLRGGRQ